MDRIPEIVAAMPVAVRAAVMKAAQQVAESAKDRVPVKTGRLRDAIHVELVGDPSEADVLSRRSVLPGGVYVLAGNEKVFYGNLVEHGHVIATGRNVPPRPFLVPALEEHRDEIIAAIAEAIRTATR